MVCYNALGACAVASSGKDTNAPAIYADEDAANARRDELIAANGNGAEFMVIGVEPL
jgi:hypothetical protein